MLNRLRRALDSAKRVALGGKSRRAILPAFILGGAVLLLVGLSTGGAGVFKTAPAPSAAPTFAYSANTWTVFDLLRHAAAGEVASISTDPNKTSEGRAYLAAKLTSGETAKVQLDVTQAAAVVSLRGLGYGPLLTDAAIAVVDGPRDPGFDPLSYLPLIVLVIVIIVVLRLMRKNMTPDAARGGAAGFQIIDPPVVEELPLGVDGKPMSLPAAPVDTSAVTMADVAGLEDVKRDVAEVIEFLKSPDKFRKLGARMPRGMLFYGPPGGGKTLLAKAIATEAGVRCIIASGSQFTEMFVGVGPKRVRELFAMARKMPAAIIFIDEFDGLAGRRGGTNENSEDRKTINELLTQLDGFRTTDNVVVIAATNRIDGLDEAAIRPGRFSRKIHVPLPDVKARREILAVHARNKPLGPDANLDSIARTTTGMSGADLAELLNEAAIFAVRREGTFINAADLREALLKVAVGSGRQRSMPVRERAIIAAHEAGHAVCGRAVGSKDVVEEVSLFTIGLADGEALGYTWSVPEDNKLPSESDLWAKLIQLMGGRAAEQILFRDLTGGAANDLTKANQIATSMVTHWGMGFDPSEGADLGEHGRGGMLSLRVRDENNHVSDSTTEAMERAILHILDTAFERATAAIQNEMPRLVRVAAYLFTAERMGGEDFEAVYTGKTPVSQADIEAWRAGTITILPPLVERPNAMVPVSPPATPRTRQSRRAAFLPRAMRGFASAANTFATAIERNRTDGPAA